MVEHFYSIQGEGKFVGKNSIFLRFGLCNLRCRGFESKTISKLTGETLLGCDSLYSVDRYHFGESWHKIESIEILNDIIKNYESNLNFRPDIVITGGEPLLNYNNPIFYEFIKLQSLNHNITIETNATINIDFEKYSAYKSLIFAMSIKLSNSLEPFEKRVNKEAIYSLITNSKCSFFKFVIDRDYIKRYNTKEIKSIVDGFQDSEIYCMSVGDRLDELSKNDKEIIEFCKSNNFIYSDRLHIRIYNQRSGV